MTSQIIICMAIFAVTLVSYMLNKIPMWVTALLSMAALYITGCIDDAGALSGFANNNTILMAPCSWLPPDSAGPLWSEVCATVCCV